jgi:hypothetical protein
VNWMAQGVGMRSGDPSAELERWTSRIAADATGATRPVDGTLDEAV